MSSTTARPTLPVSLTVGKAFGTVPANLVPLLRILWAWTVAVGASLAITVSYWALIWSPNLPMTAPKVLPSVLLLSGIGALAFSSTAVAWHRFLLMGEQPPTFYLRVGGQVPRYLGRLIIIGLIGTALQMLFGLIGVRTGLLTPPNPNMPFSAEDVLTRAVIGLVLSIPAIVVMSRLAISLPALAIGRALTLNEAMQVTKGNSWQLCGGNVLVYVPSYVVGFLLGLVTEVGNPLATLLLIGASVFSTVATTSFLSLAYRFLERAPQSVEPQPT